MKRFDQRQLLLAGFCLLSIAAELVATAPLDGSEFSGGLLTGPLLSMADYGAELFFVALICAFLFRRVAAAMAVAASALCLPLYLFFLVPVPFAKFFVPGHPLLVQHPAGIEWRWSTFVDLLVTGLTMYICYRSLLPDRVIAVSKPAPASG